MRFIPVSRKEYQEIVATTTEITGERIPTGFTCGGNGDGGSDTPGRVVNLQRIPLNVQALTEGCAPLSREAGTYISEYDYISQNPPKSLPNR